MAPIDIVSLLQAALVPLLTVSGIGLFLFVVQTRYGRVVDRIRYISAERRELAKADYFGRLSKTEKAWNEKRIGNLSRQTGILARRGRLLRDSLRFMFVAVLTFIASAFLIFVQQITGVPLSIVILVIFSSGMVMLLLATVNVIKEVADSYSALAFDMDGTDMGKG